MITIYSKYNAVKTQNWKEGYNGNPLYVVCIYCVKCKANRTIAKAKITTTKNGSVSGVCKTCGTNDSYGECRM